VTTNSRANVSTYATSVGGYTSGAIIGLVVAVVVGATDLSKS
jgi:hypothetical protein